MKIPFDIKYRPQIESGEYKIETRDGRPAKVIYWDAKADDGACIIALIPGYGGEEAYQHFPNGKAFSSKSSDEDCADLFIITPEPELTEFEIHLLDWMSSDCGGDIPMDRMKHTVRARAKELLELAKKEICKGCSANLEGFIKGRTEANKDYQQGYMDGYKKAEEDYKQSVVYHYPIYQSPCFNGGVCTNPHHDCINCPRQSSGTTINTSETNKVK